MQHRLLIIGSQDEFVQLALLAKQRGYYTIVCDGYIDTPAKRLADKVYNIDVRDTDSIARMCQAEQIDGIVGSFSDLIFEKITEIASKANLRWYVKPEMLKYYRDKNEAKQLLEELGIRVPKHCTLPKNYDEKKLDNFDFPLVAKPVNGYGSKGIYVVHSKQELDALFNSVIARSTITDKIEVEEYSSGKEYNLTSWVAKGKVYLLGIANREKNPQEGNKVPLLNRCAYPAKEQFTVASEAIDVLQRFVNFTGQKEGPLSMQFFYNDNGVEVCEIAGRIFGYEHELITYGSGLSIEELLLDYVYEPSRAEERVETFDSRYKKWCAGLYFVGKQGKVIKSLSKAKELSQDPHVAQVDYYYSEGEQIDNFGPKPYLVRYYIVASSREELDKVTRNIFNEMRIPANDGEEVAYPFVMEQ